MGRTEMLAVIRDVLDLKLDQLRRQVESIRETANAASTTSAALAASAAMAVKGLPSKNDD